MTTKIKFTKMHGAGNDYIYVDTSQYPIADPAKKAIEWSKFHTGIGSDGLILIGGLIYRKSVLNWRIILFFPTEPMWSLHRLSAKTPYG